MYEVVDNLSHQAGAHALRAGVDFLFNDDTITFPRIESRQLHVLVAREFPVGRLQQRRLHADVRHVRHLADESESRRLRAGRMESRAEPDAQRRPALRPAVAADDQHRHEQRLAAARLRVDADGVAPHRRPRQRRPVLRPRAAARGRQRAALGRQHHRHHEARPRQHQPVARTGRRAGVPEHPQRGGAARHAPQPDDDGSRTCRTRIRGRRASRSSSSSASGRRSASATSTRAASNLIISVNQNVPSCVAVGTNNGCRPISAYANNSQYSPSGGVDLSRPARLARRAARQVGLVPRDLHAVEGDGQRRRVLLQLADRSVRPHQGLGPIRRRPAASARAERRRQRPRLPGERPAAGTTRRCRSTSRPA